MENLKQTYTVRPARYAKGKLAIHCKPDGTGWKTLAALIISDMKGVSYSNRESCYIVSPGCAKKFEARMAQAQRQQEEREERNQLFEEARSTGRAIGHINGDPTNNVLSNLQVVTLQGDRR